MKNKVAQQAILAALRRMTNGEKAIGRPAPFEIESMLKRGEITEMDRKELIRYYNFRNAFMETGEGDPLPEKGLERRFLIDINGDYFRQVLYRLPMEFLRLSKHVSLFAQYLRESTPEDAMDEETADIADRYDRLSDSILEAFEDQAEIVTDVKENDDAFSYTVSRARLLRLIETLGAFLATANDVLESFLREDIGKYFPDEGNMDDSPENFCLEDEEQQEAKRGPISSNMSRLFLKLYANKPKD